MKWFKHFSNAHDNNDLTKVRVKYGADGYAIYWYCLELIASDLGSDEQITFELRHDAEVIGHNLKIDSVKVEEIMRYLVTLGLFEQAEGVITCLKLSKYLDKRTTRNSTIHKIIESASRLSETNRDVPRHSALDTDTDRDTDTDIKNKRFVKPSLQEVTEYCKSRSNSINARAFLDFYEAKGWRIGNNQMKNWKAAVRTWEARNTGEGHAAHQKSGRKPSLAERATSARKDFERREVNGEPMGTDESHLRPSLVGGVR